MSSSSTFKAPIDMNNSFKERSREIKRQIRLKAKRISAGIIKLIKIKNMHNTQNKKLITPKI